MQTENARQTKNEQIAERKLDFSEIMGELTESPVSWISEDEF
jgi:hypothetical protein